LHHTIKENINGNQGLLNDLWTQISDIIDHSGNDDSVVLENIRDQVLGEEAQSVDGGTSNFWGFVFETLGNQDIHDWVLKVFLEFVMATL
jgi:hypothetical protein